MKRALATVLTFCVLGGIGTAAPKGDEIETGLRDAYKLYQEKKYGEVGDKLRIILKMLEEKNADRVEVVLPRKVGDWVGGELTREDLELLGGGLSMKRSYRWGAKTVTVKLVKDSPLVDKLLPLLQNEQLIEASGRKVHTISGEKAVMEHDRKLQMVIEDEILLEVTGNEKAKEMDVVGIARKLDIRLMKKMK